MPMSPQSQQTARRSLPWVAISAMLVLTVGVLRLEGRRWYCAGGEWWPWVTNVWSKHCSQHPFDPYSLTHISHGLIFYGLLYLLARRLSLTWRLFIALTIAAGWEILENSTFIINRYREATMSFDYLGDSVTNSVGDIVSCGLGFFAAHRLGWRGALIIFLSTELLLLFLIR